MRPQVSEAELRSALAPAGFVWELKVPRSPDGAPSPIPCLAGCLEDSVLATLFTGSLALPFHTELVHAAVGLRRALVDCRPGARICIRWLHVPGACGEGDHSSQWTGQHARAPSKPPTCLHSCLSLSHIFTYGDSSKGVLLLSRRLPEARPVWWHRAPAVLCCAPAHHCLPARWWAGAQ